MPAVTKPASATNAPVPRRAHARDEHGDQQADRGGAEQRQLRREREPVDVRRVDLHGAIPPSLDIEPCGTAGVRGGLKLRTRPVPRLLRHA